MVSKSQFIPRAAVRHSRPLIERIVGLLIWCVGLLWTVVGLSGGWGGVLSGPVNGPLDVLVQLLTLQVTISPVMFGIAFALQCALSWAQITYSDRSEWQYWASRGVDTFFNWTAINPIFVGVWSGILATMIPANIAVGLAMVINGFLAWLNAWAPERSLVEDSAA